MSTPDSPAMDLILHHIAPGLGAIVALCMFSSPFKAVLRIRKTQNLGDMNPTPMIAIIANTTAWLIYGCLNHDPYVIAANGQYMLVMSYFKLKPYFKFATLQD
eukprot:gene6798-30768_t